METKVIRVLDSSGDTCVEFDQGSERKARALFERHLRAGAAAFKVNRGGGLPDEKVSEFGALENETIIVPWIVGG